MKVSLALLAVLGAASMVQAQNPHTPPSPAQMAQHEVQRYTTLLSLTPPQVEEATTLFTTEATARLNDRQTERSAHQALQTAIKGDDKAAIQTAAATLGQLSGESIAAHALAQAQFYALLNGDQKTKFSELEKEHFFGGGGHGHGFGPR